VRDARLRSWTGARTEASDVADEQRLGDEERLGAGWDAATAAAEQEVVAWRRAHPSPTLTALEQFTAGVALRLQRNLLEGLTAELAAEPAAAARPACPR